MITEHQNLSPAEMRQRAQEWYDRQIEVLAAAHGSSWPAHREWIESYLAEEIRQHLLAAGWRPKKRAKK